MLTHRHRGKTSIVALIAALLAYLVARPAMAVDDLSLNVAVGSESVRPGDTVTVTLDVANLSTAINGVQALIHYDDAVLALVDIVPTDLMLTPPAEGWVEVTFSDNFGDMTYAAVINGDSLTPSGTVATLTFAAIGEGTTSVTFRADSPPFFTKLTAATDNSTLSPINTIDSGNIVSSCDDGLACTADSAVGGLCQNVIQLAGTLCRASTDACDAAEVCDGVSGTCPADALEPAGMVCRASMGGCDPAEVCDGFSAACPLDVLEPADTVCRTSIGLCDPAEVCDGLTPACPADVVEPAGTPCSDGLFCNGLETCDGFGVCLPGTDPCAPLLCDEAGQLCLSPLHVSQLEVFYAGRFGTCVGGNRDGLDCSADIDCIGTAPTPDGICSLPEQPDPSRSFLAAGSTAALGNITNYIRGITGIRVFFDNIVDFAAAPGAAFTFEWTAPTGTTFSPVTDAATAITVTPLVVGGVTAVEIVLVDDHVRRRWLKVTIDSIQVTTSGVALDGELFGNPVVLPSGDGTPGGNAVFFLGNIPADVNGDRKTTLTDVGLIRNCICFNPFVFVLITELFDVDKDVKVKLGDVGAARADVNPFFTLPLISP